MEWVDDIAERGVRERGFTLECEDRTVPGVLWSPTEEPARALVLLGHGGGVHKRALGMPGQARSFVRHEGIAAVAIDAVGHGDRVRDDGSYEREFAKVQAAGGIETEELKALRAQRRPVLDAQGADHMVADWGATIDAVLAELGDLPVGYAGFSMGSFFGVPTVAGNPRIRAAALGLSGLTDGSEGPSGALAQRNEADAGRITCPVLFILQHDDELIDYHAGLRQFEAFGSVHKRLHVNPGVHAQVPPDETAFIEMFIATHLLGGSRRASLVLDRELPAEQATAPRTLG